tara:strand:- start:332 stop:784 length:453 start_codon:yes stop_codon:yes gene_type:complete
MSNYLEIDLSTVTVQPRPQGMGSSLLPKGDHEVCIEGVKATKTSKGFDQLEVNYKNDDGSRKQWIIFRHENPMTQKIGLETLKKLLDNLGWEGATPPSVEWFEGRAVKISVYQTKKDPNLSVRDTHKSQAAPATSSDFNDVDDIDDEIPF